MYGKIELENFIGLSQMPQKAASAWTATFDTSGKPIPKNDSGADFTGATYKPLLYCGSQIVKGVNYCFIAEQTLIIAKPERRLVKIAINEFNGKYEIVNESIEVIFG